MLYSLELAYKNISKRHSLEELFRVRGPCSDQISQIDHLSSVDKGIVRCMSWRKAKVCHNLLVFLHFAGSAHHGLLLSSVEP